MSLPPRRGPAGWRVDAAARSPSRYAYNPVEGERLTLELQGLAAGDHVARVWFAGAHGERLREAQLSFTM